VPIDPKTAEAHYLKMLRADTVKDLEEQFVSTLLEHLSDQILNQSLPIRLSKIAPKLQIQSRPQFINGFHDGELRFDAAKQKFIINLCNPESAVQERSLRRQRFTYAHEMAHRFFFVPDENQGWTRAIDLTTAAVTADSKLQTRRRLNDIEEPLCNRIAQRVLMPDDLLSSRCKLHDWFDGEQNFYESLSGTANDFGISRECLIVGMGDAIKRKILKFDAGWSWCLFILNRSQGLINRRGKEALRISVNIFPREVDGQLIRAPYPYCEVRYLGREAEEFFGKAFVQPQPSGGRVDLTLSLTLIKPKGAGVSGRLLGWWRSYGMGSNEFRRICVWGLLCLS
jgi:hypothetical protein